MLVALLAAELLRMPAALPPCSAPVSWQQQQQQQQGLVQPQSMAAESHRRHAPRCEWAAQVEVAHQSLNLGQMEGVLPACLVPVHDLTENASCCQ